VRHRSTQYVSLRANNDLVLLYGDVVDGVLNASSLSRLRGLHPDPPRPKLMVDNQAWESHDGLDYSDT
jgi:hypothetical protein